MNPDPPSRVLDEAGAVAARAEAHGAMLTAWRTYRRACEALERRAARLDAAADAATRARALREYERVRATVERARPIYEDAFAAWIAHRQPGSLA